MKKVTVYTDGACKGNPGPGGYAAVLLYGGREKVISGGEKETTNNRMELTAVIRALSALKEPCEVELHTDSRYVADAISKGWAAKWKQRGWIKPDGEKALNPDLWESLLSLCEIHSVTCVWVKGHDGDPNNERCDGIAVSQAESFAALPADLLSPGQDGRSENPG